MKLERYVLVASIKVNGDTIGYETKKIIPTLESYRKEIDCSIIDTVRSVHIGSSKLDIICDGEGALDKNNIMSAMCVNAEQLLVGNLIICRITNGKLMNLTKWDIKNIEENIYIQERDNGNYPILVYSYGEIKR